MPDRGIRRRRGPRPRGGRPARGALRRGSATPRCGPTTTPVALGLETLSVFAEAAPALDLGVAVMALDRHEPADIAAHIDRLGLDRERLWIGIGAGFSKKPLTEIREAMPGAPRGAARRPHRPRRDGAEDVRLRRRRGRRRLLQLDDSGLRRRRASPTSRPAPPTPAASRPRFSATSAPRLAPTPPSGWRRRSRSTATSTPAIATTSTASPSPRARSASPPRTPTRRRPPSPATTRSTSASSAASPAPTSRR